MALDPGAYVCKVELTGSFPTGNTVVICVQLTDVKGAFSYQWFDCPDTVGKEFLATAVAAVTSGLKLMVSVADFAPDEHQHGHVNEMYLLAPWNG